MTTLERRLSEECESLRLEVRSLRSRIDYLLRKLHGSSSEKIDRNQLMLELAELNDALGQAEAQPRREEPKPAPAPRAKAAGHGRRRLPETLEEQVVYLDPEEVQARPDAYREIGRETSERLDIVPPKLLRITTIRRKFVLVDEPQAAPLIAPPAPSPIEKGLPTARLLAWVAVSKFCDHMPLHRQEKALRRLGCALSRKTMCDWMRAVEFWLAGLVEQMRLQLLRGNYLQADETPIRYMDEDVARKGCGEGWLWALSAPGGDVVFHWAVTRAHAVATSLLDGYEGLLQCDGYQAYEKIEGATRVACMAHIRRKFEGARGEDVQFAAFALLSFGKLYDVERRLRRAKASPKLRQALRGSESRMVFERLGKALRRRQARHLPKTEMGKAIAYALGQWEAMSRYIEYGEAEIDNNLMENAIRPTAVGKKNWLFVGHPKAGQRSAVIYSIVVSCERRGIDPFEYLTDVLERLPAMKQADQWKLTPQNWEKNRPVKTES